LISEGVHKSFRKFSTSLGDLSSFITLVNFIKRILSVLAC
jgi:hypothetical protein